MTRSYCGPAQVEAPVDITVTHEVPERGKDRITATFKRSGANHGEPKTYVGEGSSVSEAVKDNYRRFLEDSAHGEFMPHQKLVDR